MPRHHHHYHQKKMMSFDIRMTIQTSVYLKNAVWLAIYTGWLWIFLHISVQWPNLLKKKPFDWFSNVRIINISNNQKKLKILLFCFVVVVVQCTNWQWKRCCGWCYTFFWRTIMMMNTGKSNSTKTKTWFQIAKYEWSVVVVVDIINVIGSYYIQCAGAMFFAVKWVKFDINLWGIEKIRLLFGLIE